jgi:hypothetical protein
MTNTKHNAHQCQRHISMDSTSHRHDYICSIRRVLIVSLLLLFVAIHVSLVSRSRFTTPVSHRGLHTRSLRHQTNRNGQLNFDSSVFRCRSRRRPRVYGDPPRIRHSNTTTSTDCDTQTNTGLMQIRLFVQSLLQSRPPRS